MESTGLDWRTAASDRHPIDGRDLRWHRFSVVDRVCDGLVV